MGMCGEKCAQDYGFSREDQDAYAIESYRRAQKALEDNVFEEVIPVEIPQRRGAAIVVDKDEEPNSVNLEKLPFLKPGMLSSLWDYRYPLDSCRLKALFVLLLSSIRS